MLHLFIIFSFSTFINFASSQTFDQKYHKDFTQQLQLAYIVPLDAYGKGIPEYAYKGFVHIASKRSYPSYYEIYCPTPVSYNFNLHNYFNALNQKLNDINDKFGKVWKESDDEIQQNEEKHDDSTYISSVKEQIKNFEKNFNPNFNNQSNVFQCEGYTCPSGTSQCRVSISSIQPQNLMVRHNIFCMSTDDDVIDEFEKVEANPNKGSVVNISKTFSPQGMQAMGEEVEKTLKEAQVARENKIKEMQDNMKKIFAKKQFSPWDL
ncbi:hypothetical protein PVAND_016823 [Polypedilum vanderplanki]|uniref:Uncharacterized protein n=1 Tax=Polypedilum vanderplanki TaxID=319348 RepID=A0A9J6BHH7_POLVA|nr:hypothetical protein PVAND_016823 [Polypedilum vanderplanki]